MSDGDDKADCSSPTPPSLVLAYVDICTTSLRGTTEFRRRTYATCSERFARGRQDKTSRAWRRLLGDTDVRIAAINQFIARRALLRTFAVATAP